jgi:uncharacterized protein
MLNKFIYSNTNKRYYTLDYYYKEKFHTKVAKISLDAGFTCPNIDGTKGLGGCIYCHNGSSSLTAKLSLKEQFLQEKSIMAKKWPQAKYILYFQAHSNTYAPVSTLKEIYETLLKEDNVIGLSIATRPDCINEECLDYLKDLNKRTFLQVELGLQTSNDETAKYINRCHTKDDFTIMVKKLREAHINVIVHIINGLPNETELDMLNTIKYLNTLDIQGLKIHMLSIVKGTKLATIYQQKPFKLLTEKEYVDIVVKQLELLKPNIVIHRLTGDPIQKDLIAPLWLPKKINVLNDIDKLMVKLNIYQGQKNKS